MREGIVLQLRIDLFEDLVPAMDLISFDGDKTIDVRGGGNRKAMAQIEQKHLPVHCFN